MKILLINGSSRPNGCTYTALREIADTLESGGAENLSDAEFYSFPVSGSYKYVLSITEKSEATPQADASTYNAIPEGGALVLSLSIETEGSSGSVDSVEPIGNIYDTGNGVRFEANPSMGVIDLPDAPTTCVTFVGVDGSVLYQTYNDVSDCFSENESGYLVFDTTGEPSRSEVLTGRGYISCGIYHGIGVGRQGRMGSERQAGGRAETQ